MHDIDYDTLARPWEAMGLPDPQTVRNPIDRRTYLSAFLKKLPESKFDMGSISCEPGRGNCGTPACIAGWASTLFGDPKAPNGWEDFWNVVGMEHLGMTHYEANALFFDFPNAVTSAQAAKVLDNYIENGVVDWTILQEPA